MNPMTNVKNILKLNEREIQLGIKQGSSWHNIYKNSPWLFIGGLDYELTEGDIICVFSQYGEINEINLVRDKKTGKSKGFCFLNYQNKNSTILAVDNLNGIKLCGRTIRVDHVANYRPPKEDKNTEDEDVEDQVNVNEIKVHKKEKEKKKKHKKLKRKFSDDDDDSLEEIKHKKKKHKKLKKKSVKDDDTHNPEELKLKQKTEYESISSNKSQNIEKINSFQKQRDSRNKHNRINYNKPLHSKYKHSHSSSDSDSDKMTKHKKTKESFHKKHEQSCSSSDENFDKYRKKHLTYEKYKNKIYKESKHRC